MNARLRRLWARMVIGRHRHPRASVAATSTRLPLVLSATALAVAVLGTTPLVATAQNVAFPRSSVGSAQLKRNAVTAAKIAPDAVRAAHVQNGSLLAADFKPGQLPQGPKGDKGDRGEEGDKGEKGDEGATNVVVRSRAGFASGGHITADCNPGERAVGGGAGWARDGRTSAVKVTDSKPWPLTGIPTGWQAGADATGEPWAVYVICSSP